jgi:hypothetical protein
MTTVITALKIKENEFHKNITMKVVGLAIDVTHSNLVNTKIYER